MNTTATAERQALAQDYLTGPTQHGLPTIYSMSESDAVATLSSSFYPGAKRESVIAVLKYCRASNLDPMQRPVHIVPMRVKAGKDAAGDDVYEMRDVIMPGIGLYRIQATRTGCYVGQEEPEFGPNQVLSFKKKVTSWHTNGNGKRVKSERLDDVELTYPLWCKVTVYRFVQGRVCAFVAKELWLENYATASRWTDAPNEMWEKRTFAQLAKCCEAQALRKAFPDAVSQAPTWEEMEAQRHDFDLDDGGNVTEAAEQAKAPVPPRKSDAAAPAAPAPQAQHQEEQGDERPEPIDPEQTTQAAAAPVSTAAGPAPGTFMATGGERQNIISRCRTSKRDLGEFLGAVLGADAEHINVDTLEGMTKEQFKAARAALAA